MSTCKIHLENYNERFHPGSELRGRIECDFREPTTVRSIKIRIKCKEHNSWTSTESYTDSSGKQRTRTVTLVGNNYVLHLDKLLIHSVGQNTEIPPGNHVYPFSYTLPLDLPSTFKGPYGYIAYKIKAIVDRPWKLDYTHFRHFYVLSPIDLNRIYRHLQDAIAYSDEKTVCSWCCSGGHMSMDVKLPKQAFVPGETVPFEVRIVNLSNTNVENLGVKLVKTVTSRVRSPHSESRDSVYDIIVSHQHGVGAHGEHTYSLRLVLPTGLEVPNFQNCILFSVRYKLRVTAIMPTCTTDLYIKIKGIQLGHVQVVGPVSNGNDVPLPPPYAPPAEGTSELPGYDQSSAPSAPEGLPPSYSQVHENIGFVYS